jgi:hypothetical protein
MFQRFRPFHKFHISRNNREYHAEIRRVDGGNFDCVVVKQPYRKYVENIPSHPRICYHWRS